MKPNIAFQPLTGYFIISPPPILRVMSIVVVCLALCVATMSASLNERVFSSIDTRHGLSDNQVLHLLQLPDGRMVITTLGNINIYDAAGFDYVHYDSDTHYPLPAYRGHQHVYVSRDGLLWNKSWGHVQCFSLNTNSYISNIDSILATLQADPTPLDLFVDRDGVLWTVYEKGLLDTHNKRYFPLPGSALQDVESKGDTVMLFYDTGMMEGFDRRSGKRLWQTRAYADSTAYPCTSLVRITPSGTVLQLRNSYKGTGVLLSFDTRSLVWKEVLQTPYVLHTLTVSSDDEAYIASRKGLWHIDLNTLDTRLIRKLRGMCDDISLEEGFNTLFIDHTGGCWVGTYNDGVLYSPPGKPHLLSRHELSALGINRESLTKIKLEENRSLKDKEGRIWTATLDGLRISDPSLQRDTILYVEAGLSNNCIKSLASAPDGTVWVSTANGINSISFNSPQDIYIEAYTNENGALPGEYYEGEAYMTPEGNLVFAHPLGWTLVDTLSSDEKAMSAAPLVRQITVNGSPVAVNAEGILDLSHDRNDIVIDFASLNFAHPGSTVWQYRIFDKETKGELPWHTYHAASGNSTFHLTMPRQKPGNYKIQVRSAVGNGAPFGPPVEITVIIHLPWWWSGWALACYVIILLGLCSGGWILYRRIEKRRIEKRHKEETMLLRMTELIERCNYYEEKVRAQSDKEEPVPDTADTSGQASDDKGQPEMSQEDMDFIARAINLVELNMDKGYSVEKLSSDLCMERTGLYKRLTALLDKSPSVFIRSIRLNHVARLVEEGQLSMSEIAELTGFSSSSHMSRCFKEERGCTPTEYARRMASKTDETADRPEMP